MNALISYVVPAIHVVACLFLIVVVLLQTGKGADMGAVFGGGSQTLFGASGAGNFLTKLTTATFIAFLATSLFLTWGQSRSTTARLIEQLPPPSASAPATPQGGAEPAAPTAPEPSDTAPPASEAPAPPGQ
jgi:preprotein translocase subunit SecG